MEIRSSTVRALQRKAQDEMEAQIKTRAQHETSYSLVAMIRSRMRGHDLAVNRSAVDFGLEVSESMRQRGGGVAPGGFWVPVGMLTRATLTSSSDAALSNALNSPKFASGSIQAALLPDSGIFSGATVLTGIAGSDLQLTTLESVGDASGSFVTEIGAAATVDPTFKNVSLTPLNLRFIITVSRLALFKSGGALEDVLRREMARKAIAVIERAVINGAGGSSPLGLLNNPGISTLSAGVNGAAPTWAHVVECEFDAATRNAPSGSAMFLASPKLRKKLRSTQRGSGLDYIMPASSRELMSYPLAVSTDSPDNLTKGTSNGVCSSLIFGDMSEVFIAFYGPVAIDVFVDDVTRTQQGEVRLICSSELGVGVRNISAFSCYKDLLAA